MDAIGNEVFIVPVIGAPFTTSAALRGTETIYQRTLYRPGTGPYPDEGCYPIGEKSDRRLCKSRGVPVTVEPVATGSMISERHFREFVLPYLKEVYAHIHSYNLPGVLHICGKNEAGNTMYG